ncbi:MAG: protein YgfX [Pseudomonadota bacterium]
MSQTLTLSIRPSRILALVLTLMAGTALAAAWSSLPELAIVPIAAGILLALVWHIPDALHRGARGVRALELGAEGDARWQDGSGRWHEGKIMPSSYVSAWLVVVNLDGNARAARALVLLPDSAAAEDLRRLRVWLRWRLER